MTIYKTVYWDSEAGEQRERDCTPEEVAEIVARNTALLTQQEYADALTAMLDAKAQEKHYDNRITCALRAGYAGPFHDEGASFAGWMDACNYLAYQLLAEVRDGTRSQPTLAEFLALMPTLSW